MTVEDIEVPDGMMDVLCLHLHGTTYKDSPHRVQQTTLAAQKVALLWLTKNPIAPTRDEAEEIGQVANQKHVYRDQHYTVAACSEWISRVFRKKTEKLPEPVRNLISNYNLTGVAADCALMAYEAGAESKK